MVTSANTVDASRPIRVVAVDDSATMLALIRAVFSQDPNLTVVGVATSAQDAREVIKATHPDVLVLDLEMPNVNGLEFLGHIMRLWPMPVVVFSAYVACNQEVAQKARDMGAVAVLSKATRNMEPQFADLRKEVTKAGRALQANNADGVSPPERRLLLIGASTGGVGAIEEVLGALDRSSPPIVIAQHMPHRFLVSFCERLGQQSRLRVAMAQDGMTLVSGAAHIAPANGVQTLVRFGQRGWQIVTRPQRPGDAYCPMINDLFASAVPWAKQVGAMLLTGLGDDGAEGMYALFSNGARTIVQDSHSCVVDGMPSAAQRLGAAEAVAHPQLAGPTLLRLMDNAP